MPPTVPAPAASAPQLPTERPTPHIDRLLAELRGRLVRYVWMHGLATVAGATAAWLLVAFLVDWLLHVPSGIRWIHLTVLALVPGLLIVRELVRPLRRVPRRAELAVLIERAHPELRQLLVSAVELGDARPLPPGSGDPELVARLLERAEQRAATLELAPVLDPRGPRRRALTGAAVSLAVALVLALNAGAASIFLERLFGGDRPWPRRTQLLVEVPLPGSVQPEAFEPADGAEPAEIRLRVARGSDVPLIVRAVGVVPDEVHLHFKDGERAVLASTGGPVFRTLLRSLQEDTEFYCTGGDDDDQIPWVRLSVLQPPDVEALAVRIRPPAYSGLPERLEFDRDVEVLQGSQLTVHILPTPRAARGSVRLLPEDRALPLEELPFPARAGEQGEQAGLGFELRVDAALRYRFELADDSGLANPDPGLFAVSVLDDKAPEVELIAPARSEVDTLRGGLIALRARAEDDYGIAELVWTVENAAEDARGAAVAERPLEWRLLSPEERAAEAERRSEGARGTPARFAAVGGLRLEVDRLAEPAQPAGAEATPPAPGAEPAPDAAAALEGQQFLVGVRARDNRTPEARVGRTSALRVRVVSTDEFVRRLQDRLARVQTQVNALVELQRDKARRTGELLAVLESDQLELEGAEGEIGGVTIGQRRAHAEARSLARELAALLETVLYARLDERAADLLEFLDQRLALATRRGFDPAPWRELAAARARGEQGQTALSGKLVAIVGLALELSEDDTRAAAEALQRAQTATERDGMHAALQEASTHERLALDKLERLLGMLAEWDNFQSVLGLARDLLQGQKTLQERTKAALKEK